MPCPQNGTGVLKGLRPPSGGGGGGVVGYKNTLPGRNIGMYSKIGVLYTTWTTAVCSPLFLLLLFY